MKEWSDLTGADWTEIGSILHEVSHPETAEKFETDVRELAKKVIPDVVPDLPPGSIRAQIDVMVTIMYMVVEAGASMAKNMHPVTAAVARMKRPGFREKLTELAAGNRSSAGDS